MGKTMQDVFKAERQAWLDSARATARGLLLDMPLVTIEDVLKECPRPTFLHRNITGQVFKSPDFRCVGWRKSSRPLMNGRHVRLWRLADAD